MQERVMESHEGYRFHPTDSELLTFLLRFIADKDLCDDGYITQLDVYKQEPWITYDHGRHCGGKDTGDTSINRYFITPRSKKRDDGSRFTRTVGQKLGTWKQQDKGKYVTMSHSGNLGKSLTIGQKKSLRYEITKGGSSDDGNWLMKEYVFSETILRKFRESARRDYAICAIRKMAPKRNSSKGNNMRAIMDCSAQENVDVKVKLEVNSVEPLMDQEYNVTTPVNSTVETMVESDEPEVQEAAGVLGNTFSRMEEFENAMPGINLPKEPVLLDRNQPQYQLAPLQEGCNVGVNEDYIAYLELEATHTSFAELLSGGTDSALRNNQVQTQELVIPDFANKNSDIDMHKTLDILEEFMGAKVLIDPDYYLLNPLDYSKQAIVESNEPQVQTQETAGEENGMLGITAPSSQIQEFVISEINMPKMLDTGDTLLQKNQTQHQPTPQEESETLCKTEKSSFISDPVEALLGKATMKDRLDANHTNESTLFLDQQSWQSKAHLQDMLP